MDAFPQEIFYGIDHCKTCHALRAGVCGYVPGIPDFPARILFETGFCKRIRADRRVYVRACRCSHHQPYQGMSVSFKIFHGRRGRDRKLYRDVQFRYRADARLSLQKRFADRSDNAGDRLHFADRRRTFVQSVHKFPPVHGRRRAGGF